MGDQCYNRLYRLGADLLIALLIIIGTATISIPTEAQTVSGLNQSQLLRLEREEILVDVVQTGDSQRGLVEAIILIEAPAENIWQIMMDCGEMPNFLPRLKSCHVLDSGPDWEIIRHEVKMIWFLPTVTYVFRADYKPHRKIDFVRIRGDLKEMKGSWRLTPLNGDRKTIVFYSVYLDPGFFVPQWLVRRSLKADLPALLSSLRKKVLSSQAEP